jgi:hypothetical protein
MSALSSHWLQRQGSEVKAKLEKRIEESEKNKYRKFKTTHITSNVSRIEYEF